MTSLRKPRINVVGTTIDALNLDEAVDEICRWMDDESTGRYVCVTDVHCIMQSYRRPDVRTAYNSASLCVPDGMPLTWFGWVRGHRTMGRVYGPDLMLRLLEVSAREGYTNFFCGGAEGVAEDLERRATRRFPNLRVVGTYCPPFRPLTQREREEFISTVNDLQPDFLWVGLGAPKQDLFMKEFHQLLTAKVMIGVGAAFDFHTGRLRQAPRWMMKAGLEWFFRLCMEPRRLAPRYFRNNPAFIWHVFLQLSGLRKYPTDSA
jgi:N-acetylglucosaminyldiphosphoundecaprenol N-acetyl-beta-D-mannosaminyltransferase